MRRCQCARFLSPVFLTYFRLGFAQQDPLNARPVEEGGPAIQPEEFVAILQDTDIRR
jgi:hypothetical protein